jgi:hypothetical protein
LVLRRNSMSKLVDLFAIKALVLITAIYLDCQQSSTTCQQNSEVRSGITSPGSFKKLEKIVPINEMSANQGKFKPTVLADIEPKDKSGFRIAKEAGPKSLYDLVHSHSLKMHNDDDYQHAEQIVPGFWDLDQEEYEARTWKENNGK